MSSCNCNEATRANEDRPAMPVQPKYQPAAPPAVYSSPADFKPNPQPNEARIKELERVIEALMKELDALRRGMKVGKTPDYLLGVIPGGTSKTAKTGHTLVNKRTVKLPVFLEEKARTKIFMIVLLVSQDEGKTWYEIEKFQPTGERLGVPVQAADGVYWFTIDTIYSGGNVTPDSRMPRSMPALKVEIDDEG